jgi:hypothetical protein
MRTNYEGAIYQSSTTTNRASKAPYRQLHGAQGRPSLRLGESGAHPDAGQSFRFASNRAR